TLGAAAVACGGVASAAGAGLAAAFGEGVKRVASNPEVQRFVGDIVKRGAAYFNREEAQKALKAAKATPEDLAAKYGVREDSAAAYINEQVRLPGPGYTPVYDLSKFDEVTGKAAPVLPSETELAALERIWRAIQAQQGQ